MRLYLQAIGRAEARDQAGQLNLQALAAQGKPDKVREAFNKLVQRTRRSA